MLSTSPLQGRYGVSARRPSHMRLPCGTRREAARRVCGAADHTCPERELHDNGITLKRADRCAARRTCPVFDRLLAFKPTDYADRLITTGGDATCAATRDGPATRQKQASRSYPRSRL
jgi:hypothetical protein